MRGLVGLWALGQGQVQVLWQLVVGEFHWPIHSGNKDVGNACLLMNEGDSVSGARDCLSLAYVS